jgi:hypothetical protein
MNSLPGRALRACFPEILSLMILLPCGDAQAQSVKPIFLEQGWTAELREGFYYTPQGSRLMPYKWFLSLEQAESANLFADPLYLETFGWLLPYEGASSRNPDALPVGFVRDPVDIPITGKWVGLNCAACHTGELTFKGARLRIDGGQSLTDVGRFLAELSRAVNANSPVVDQKKFRRFATRVIGENPSPEAFDQLKNAYMKFATSFTGQIWMRTPPLPAGPGRIDALTETLNTLAAVNLGVPENLRPPAAPTSYPFLWLTPKLEWVQWNPLAADPIARNTSEVLAVFGEANFGRDVTPRFSSSVLFENLFQLEGWIDSLTPPQWPEALLGPIEEARWRKGVQLFRRDCLQCHNMPPFDMTRKQENIAGKQFIKIGRVDYRAVGTDPLYIQTLVERTAETGALADSLFNGRKIIPAVEFFVSTVRATVEHGLAALNLPDNERMSYSGYRFRPVARAGAKPEPYRPPSVTDIKAGPLLGIWATSPYLHNGSVPNLYELLLPADKRSKVFWVGSRELDTGKMGFVSTEARGLFRFDTRLPGNSNSGHVYPEAPYDDEERRNVIEYLKDPGRFQSASPK